MTRSTTELSGTRRGWSGYSRLTPVPAKPMRIGWLSWDGIEMNNYDTCLLGRLDRQMILHTLQGEVRFVTRGEEERGEGWEKRGESRR